MSASEIDEYLAGIENPDFRAALATLREQILDVVPEAEQCISYGMPGFRVDGKVVAGFAAFSKHLGYYPHSGSVIGEVGPDAEAFASTKGALQFTPDNPLPDSLVRRMIEVKRAQAGV